ncbi:DUF6907 domain-containing protein [Nonomuraea sp. NPDC051941]|uniref:DUF6907 domain-containing protein n=1 Tax=Nonomuraea sp. NPDC051941 TaxID=3364373 RepID=UPI0037C96189
MSNPTTPKPASATEPQLPATWEEEARKAGEQAAFRVRVSYDAEMRAYEHERATKPTAYWLASDPCAPWCTNDDIHRSSDVPDDRVHDSAVHTVSLYTMEPVTVFAEFTAPELTLQLTQRYREGEPRVFLNDSGDDTRLYATLDEAEKIAFALLDLVRQGRGQEPLKVMPFDSEGRCRNADCVTCRVEKTA